MSPQSARSRVIAIVARSPVSGPVKTRMRPVLSEDQCLALHIAMTGEVVRSALAVDTARVELWLDGDAGEFAAFAAHPDCVIRRQVAGDLGARMSAIVRPAIAAQSHVVVLGADCPLIAAQDIERLFAALAQGRDASIVPALDGGYVALALAKYSCRLFADKNWGCDDVAAATIADLRQLGWRYAVASPVPDIDRPDDLKWLSRVPALAAFSRFAP